VNDIIYQFGNILIIALFSYLAYIKFKDFNEIDLREHKWIIFIYILLLVLTIIVWRIIYLIIETNFSEAIQYNNTIKSVENG